MQAWKAYLYLPGALVPAVTISDSPVHHYITSSTCTDQTRQQKAEYGPCRSTAGDAAVGLQRRHRVLSRIHSCFLSLQWHNYSGPCRFVPSVRTGSVTYAISETGLRDRRAGPNTSTTITAARQISPMNNQ